MFEMALYFLVSYAALCLFVLPACLLSPKLRGWRSSRKRRNAFWSVFWLLPFLPYAVVEGQTLLFGSMLVPVARQALRSDDEVDQLRFMRVLLITPVVAKVYVVVPYLGAPDFKKYVGYEGFTIDMQMTRHGWQAVQEPGTLICDGVWSEGGNADGNVFPPYPALGDYK